VNLWDRVLERRNPTPNPYLDDPVAWATERAGAELWSGQRAILESVRVNRKTAVKACHGPGKSFTAGNVVAWWCDVHPPGSVMGVTSAPTAPQVSLILWKELRRAHKAGALPGRIVGGNGSDAWKIGDEVIATGRKPADHDADGFQGIHEDYVLVVLDEACGIPQTLWTATDTLVTNEASRILAIGNPDHPQSRFAEICDGAPEDGSPGFSRLGWWVITISVFDTPNFTGEEVSEKLASRLPAQVWLDDFTRTYGKDSPLYTSKVLGRFPRDASDGVAPWSWLQNCRGEEHRAKIPGGPVHLGLDVGGSENGDESVIAARAGMRALPDPARIRTGNSEEIVDLAVAEVMRLQAVSVKVDIIGVGFGVAGSLRRRLETEVAWHVDVHDVNVSDAAQQPDRFVNLKAEMWWEIGRMCSQSRSWDLSDVDEQTLNELSAPRYFEKNKRIQVESKQEVRKRLGRSTDNADALLLAFYEPPVAPPVAAGHYKDRRRRGRR